MNSLGSADQQSPKQATLWARSEQKRPKQQVLSVLNAVEELSAPSDHHVALNYVPAFQVSTLSIRLWQSERVASLVVPQ